MAQDMPLFALLYFHNCGVVLIQSTAGDKNARNMRRVRQAWPHTRWEGERFPEVKALLFLRGEVADGPRGHWVTSASCILSRGQSAQEVHQRAVVNAAGWEEMWRQYLRQRCLSLHRTTTILHRSWIAPISALKTGSSSLTTSSRARLLKKK